MNIKITSFTNPFSFFCVNEDYSDHIKLNLIDSNPGEVPKNISNKLIDANHGQYVAVMWKNKWARGVISMQSQFLIWLIDYGIFLRPNENTIFIDLPSEYRKQPTKIFEASIHGVAPLDKVLSEDCQIKNEITTSWTQGSIEKSQKLIRSATKIFFQPFALLETAHNEVLLGDLFLEIEGKDPVNIIDELESWPIFLERNSEVYIKNLHKMYTNGRIHSLCSYKPDLPDLPKISCNISLDEYISKVEQMPKLDTKFEYDSLCGESTAVEFSENKDKREIKITPTDIEKYSNSYITINGREYNVLTMLINKARDLNICERYKDHDLKSIGRGCSYRSSFI
ncbi:unnamed protein product, partial [Brenthis ino]